MRIFPELTGRRWAEVSLDALAQRDFPDGENPLLDAAKCDAWVQGIAAELGVDYTFGGWLEDRAHLWRGHYLPAGPQAHLGVDYNVPAGVRVTSFAGGEVVHVARDGQWGGWGGVVVLRLASPPAPGADYLYFGHLAWETLPVPGQKIAAGETVGHTGLPHENGQWFPHLHVQLSSREQVAAAGGDYLAVDGYRAPPVSARDFPDPRPYVAS